MDNLKSETISGVKWTAIEKFSTQIVNFLLGLLLARLLSPSDFGTIGMVGIFMAISGTFIDSGFSSALIRKPEISDKDYSTAFYFNIVVGLLCYAIMFVCSPLIARFCDMPILNGIVKVYSVTLFINSLTSVQYAKLKFKGKSICHPSEFKHYRDYSEGYLPFAGKNPGRRVFGLQCPISVEV